MKRSLYPQGSRVRIEDIFTAVGFELRRSLWGRLRLRRGLPTLHDGGNRNELAYYRLLLETSVPARLSASVSLVIDVGCRNWSYAPSLATTFSEAALLGVELDPGRRAWNLFRRRDYALAQASLLSKKNKRARCVFGDFRTVPIPPELIPPQGSQIFFTFFYPFVSEVPCWGWGLPSRFADFSGLLHRAKSWSASHSLTANFLSAHQGEWEAELARDMFSKANLTTREIVIAPERFTDLWPSAYPTYLFAGEFTHPR